MTNISMRLAFLLNKINKTIKGMVLIDRYIVSTFIQHITLIFFQTKKVIHNKINIHNGTLNYTRNKHK